VKWLRDAIVNVRPQCVCRMSIRMKGMPVLPDRTPPLGQTGLQQQPPVRLALVPTARSSNTLIFAPTYNERATIEPLLDALLGLANHCDVLIVDDNSTDGTVNVLVRTGGVRAKAPADCSSRQARHRFGAQVRLGVCASARLREYRDDGRGSIARSRRCAAPAGCARRRGRRRLRLAVRPRGPA